MTPCAPSSRLLTRRMIAQVKPEIHTVLCAVDLTEESPIALHCAAQLAESTGAELRIVNAIPIVNPMGTEYFYYELQTDLADNARDQIEQLQRSEGTHAVSEIVTGDVAHALRCAAKTDKANIMVIGRSINDSLVGRLRTHAYPIIRHSPCPVISV